MKKLFKPIYAILFLFVLVFLSACEVTCPHIDEDQDGVCDNCYLVMEEREECKVHVDENNDFICDKCEAELEQPHVHEYVNGKCECGEKDPNYIPPHVHEYVDGKCECGEEDPNYIPPHVHEYVDGKCECGEEDPNYVPDNSDVSEEGYVIKVKVGVPYILKLEHGGLGRTLYITGNMDGYYYETTSKLSESIVIYLEEAQGGYYVYHLKNDQKIYLDIIPSGTHINVVYVNTPGDPWKFDETVNTLTNPVNGTDYMLGTATNKTYQTYSANKLTYASTTYIAYLFKAEDLNNNVDKPVVPDKPIDPSELEVNHADYYKDVLGLTGEALADALGDLMNETHTFYISYGESRYLFSETDPADVSGKIICFYSGELISATWDQGATWNREHVWPKSLSGDLYKKTDNSYRGAGSDMHMLRPTKSSINSSRGNKMFGTTGSCYEPRDEVKGDVARILFYMSVHYDMDIESLGVASSIEMLLEWNKLDPVDEKEAARNEVVKSKQGNYNPFVDCEEFADLIW